MAENFRITGVDELVNRLIRTNGFIEKGIGAGLKQAGKYLLKESQKIVPVQKGILKASGFVKATGSGASTNVAVGYTATYGLYVHENLEAAHGKAFNEKHAEEITTASTPAQKRIWFRRGPNQQAKFLEKPAREGQGKMLQIIEQTTERFVR